MRIAVLGSTSQIARDLVQSFSPIGGHEWVLFARRPEVVAKWLLDLRLPQPIEAARFSAFTLDQTFDVVLNCVGVGDPARAMAMGASIFDVTIEYDELALRYIRKHPTCRYIFLSSGAAYGSNFSEPADDSTNAQISINNLQPHEWYGAAKLHAECRHRALPTLPIVDIRIFNYFSSTLSLGMRFLISDILRSIKYGKILHTSPENVIRDYIGPKEMMQLFQNVLESPPQNSAIDCFTRGPIDKFSLLEKMSQEFGLRYAINELHVDPSATGTKPNYYSKSRKAAELFGYAPEDTAIQVVLNQSRHLLLQL